MNSSEVKQGSKRSQGKQSSEHSQRFDFNFSKVKQHSVCKERFHFNNSGKVKQGSKRCQKHNFSISKGKQGSVRREKFPFNSD